MLHAGGLLAARLTEEGAIVEMLPVAIEWCPAVWKDLMLCTAALLAVAWCAMCCGMVYRWAEVPRPGGAAGLAQWPVAVGVAQGGDLLGLLWWLGRWLMVVLRRRGSWEEWTGDGAEAAAWKEVVSSQTRVAE